MSSVTQILVAALGGGVSVKAIEQVLYAVGVLSGSQKEFRSDMAARIGRLQNRVDDLEEQLRDEVWSRMKAEAMLMKLMNSHNSMRSERGMEELTYEDIEARTLDPRDLRR